MDVEMAKEGAEIKDTEKALERKASKLEDNEKKLRKKMKKLKKERKARKKERKARKKEKRLQKEMLIKKEPRSIEGDDLDWV
jgi:DNA gyrase/topoisomerase IV subunit A